jgi:retinol-binding protein 3
MPKPRPGRRLALVATLLLLSAVPAVRAEGPESTPLEPGEAVRVLTAISDRVSAYYVDEDKGRAIAEALRSRIAGGGYAGVGSREDLLTRATEELQELSSDGHFRLMHDPEHFAALVEAQAREAEQGVEDLEAQFGHRRPLYRRLNYGYLESRILPGGIGFIRHRVFAPLFPEAKRAADGALAGAPELNAMILDLRDNTGGHVPHAMYLAGYFVGPDMVVGTDINRLEETVVERRTPTVDGELLTDIPLYVLIGPETYSAAEDLAFFLQLRHRATLVGQTTGGGAHLTSPALIEGGYILALPVERTDYPGIDGDYERVGVSPDVEAPVEEAAAVAHALALDELAEGARSHPESAERIFGQDAAKTITALESLARGARARTAAVAARGAEGAPAHRALADYSGTYESLAIRIVADQLVAAQGHYVSAELAPTGVPDEFAAQDEFGTLYAFEREGPLVVAVERNRPGLGERRFERTQP